MFLIFSRSVLGILNFFLGHIILNRTYLGFAYHRILIAIRSEESYHLGPLQRGEYMYMIFHTLEIHQVLGERVVLSVLI
jgi:hypothetical protein